MKKIEVLLLKRCTNLGYQGDVVSVRRGYARNFLIRSGVAVIMTAKREKERQTLIKLAEEQKVGVRKAAKEVAEMLKDHIFEIKAMMDVKGGLYGAITGNQILSLVNEYIKESGMELTKKDLIMTSPIRQMGNHNVSVRLFKHGNDIVTGSVTVSVSAIGKSTKKENQNVAENIEQKDKSDTKEDLIVNKDQE